MLHALTPGGVVGWIASLLTPPSSFIFSINAHRFWEASWYLLAVWLSGLW